MSYQSRLRSAKGTVFEKTSRPVSIHPRDKTLANIAEQRAMFEGKVSSTPKTYEKLNNQVGFSVRYGNTMLVLGSADDPTDKVVWIPEEEFTDMLDDIANEVRNGTFDDQLERIRHSFAVRNPKLNKAA